MSFQDGYPVLAGEGQVAFSFYNGLSDKCDIPVFAGTYRIDGSTKDEPFTIDFKEFTKYENDPDRERRYVVNKEWPNANYTVSKTTVICGTDSYTFEEYKFGPYAEPVSKHCIDAYF
jgi:hypothetical protein